MGGLLPAVVGSVAFGNTIGAPCSQNLLRQDLLKASSRKMPDITVDYVFVFVYIVVPAYTAVYIVAAGSAIFQQFEQRKIDWESIE